jgi:3-deoxy-D-arabino-heptulosonate 7-phosphate (DAHP) synthase class II
MNKELKAPTECRECGGSNLYWFTSMRNSGQAQNGRLRINEVAFDSVLRCGDCSETLKVISAEKIAECMTVQQQDTQ